MILRQEPDADPWCSQTPVSQKEIGSARVFIGKTKGPPRGVSFGHIAAQKLVRPLRILGSGVDPINSSRPIKMSSGVDSTPDWRPCPELGKIATKNFIRLLRVLGPGPHPARWIQIQGPIMPFSGQNHGFQGRSRPELIFIGRGSARIGAPYAAAGVSFRRAQLVQARERPFGA